MNELQQPHEIDNIRSTFSDLRSNKLKESSPIFRTYLLNEIDLLKILTIAVGKIGPPKENSLAEGAESQKKGQLDGGKGDFSVGEMNSTNPNQGLSSTKQLKSIKEKIGQLLAQTDLSTDALTDQILDIIHKHRRQKILEGQKFFEKPNRIVYGGAGKTDPSPKPTLNDQPQKQLRKIVKNNARKRSKIFDSKLQNDKNRYLETMLNEKKKI